MRLKDYEFTRLSRGGLFVGRMKTRDDAFKYRMGAGFAGDVNRTHPVDIVAEVPDATYFPTAYGMGVILDGTSHQVRMLKATGDTGVTSIYGVVVRPYPTQTPQASVDFAPSAFGAGAPPATGTIDIMRRGYIIVQLGDGQLTGAVKGGTVYITAQANTGHELLGYFSTVSSGNAAIANAFFNGVQDANGLVEIAVNI